MNSLRSISFVKGIWLFMAIYLFNVSVDSKDVTNLFGREDIRLNEIESIVELVVEEVMDFNEAIPEHHDQDGEKNTFKGLSTLFTPATFFFSINNTSLKQGPAGLFLSRRAPFRSADVLAPPPKA